MPVKPKFTTVGRPVAAFALEAVMAGLDRGLGEKVSEAKRSASSAMLTGLLWAPDGRAWRSAGQYYRLEGKPGRLVRHDVLDEAVTAAVLQDVESEGFLATLIEASRERAADSGPREQLGREVGRLRREREKAARLALESDDPIYTGLVAERGRQITGLEREIAALVEDDEVTRRLRTLTPSVFRDLIESKEPAALVLSLVERIVVGPDLAGTILYRQAGAVSVASPRVGHRYGSGLERRFKLAA